MVSLALVVHLELRIFKQIQMAQMGEKQYLEKMIHEKVSSQKSCNRRQEYWR
jgi:hypothetical protein